MRELTLVLIFLHASIILSAQNTVDSLETRPLQNISLNLLGDASILSFNYERQFIVGSALILSSKLGIGSNVEFEPFSNEDVTYLTIPHHITGNLGKGRHFFEFGLGGTFLYGETTQPYIAYPIFGYRLMPLRANRFGFRIFGQFPFSGLPAQDILFIVFGVNFSFHF